MAKKKYALVLSGGGFKGAYQLGAIRFIKENWTAITGLEEPMRFDIIAGVSVGALNGVLVASGKFESLENIWKSVRENGGREIYESGYINNDGKIQLNFNQLKSDLVPGFKVNAGLLLKASWNATRHLFSKKTPGFLNTILKEVEKEFDVNFPRFKSLANNKPLEDKLKQYVDLKHIPESTLFLCGLVSLNDGLYYALSQKDFTDNNDFIQAILASTAMPVIWPPAPIISAQNPVRTIGNSVDGGIRNTSPLGDVVNQINMDTSESPYEVIIINCNSGYISPINAQWNIADIALRTLTEITLAEIFNNDVQEFLKINDLVAQARKGNIDLRFKGDTLKQFSYKLIQPDREELGDTLDSRIATIDERELLGYAHAQKVFTIA